MKQALSGYWSIFRKHGLLNAINSFYLYYYRQYKLKKINPTKDHIIETHGYKLLVIPHDEGISSELIIFGSHEPIGIKLVSKKLKQGMTCLDVGANIGYYAVLESKIIGNEGKVIAIEPSPLNFKYLEHNLKLQNQSNYVAYNLACGDHEGEVDFLIFNKKSNYCQVLQNGKEIPPDTEIKSVPVKRIDTIISELNLDNLDLLRMDVEGYDWYAILGARDIIRKFKPMIKIEVHLSVIGSETTRKLFDFFLQEGYDTIFYITEKRDPVTKSKTKAGVTKITFDELFSRLDKDELPLTLSLFLECSKVK